MPPLFTIQVLATRLSSRGIIQHWTSKVQNKGKKKPHQNSSSGHLEQKQVSYYNFTTTIAVVLHPCNLFASYIPKQLPDIPNIFFFYNQWSHKFSNAQVRDHSFNWRGGERGMGGYWLFRNRCAQINCFFCCSGLKKVQIAEIDGEGREREMEMKRRDKEMCEGEKVKER